MRVRDWIYLGFAVTVVIGVACVRDVGSRVVLGLVLFTTFMCWATEPPRR